MKYLVVFPLLFGCLETNLAEKICLEGHSYYRLQDIAKAGFAPVFDDDGKPEKCVNKP